MTLHAFTSPALENQIKLNFYSKIDRILIQLKSITEGRSGREKIENKEKKRARDSTDVASAGSIAIL